MAQIWLITFIASNGTPLQYSCLENSMDGGAWWAAVHGVTKSRTQLKWLSTDAGLLFYEVIKLLSLLCRCVHWEARRWFHSCMIAKSASFTCKVYPPGCQSPDHTLGCSVASFWSLNRDAFNSIVLFVYWYQDWVENHVEIWKLVTRWTTKYQAVGRDYWSGCDWRKISVWHAVTAFGR